MKSERDAIQPLTAISTEPLDNPLEGSGFMQVERSAPTNNIWLPQHTSAYSTHAAKHTSFRIHKGSKQCLSASDIT
jgi:hypothetical protein